jgi:hypothetical protein
MRSDEKISNQIKTIKTIKQHFYLSHMKYGKSIGFVSGKMIFFIGNNRVLGHFLPKKHDSSKKKSVRHAPSQDEIKQHFAAFISMGNFALKNP